MTELGLIALAIYLVLRQKSKPDSALPPDQRSKTQSEREATTGPGSRYEKSKKLPWFWPVIPDFFTEVPLNPKSRSNWLALVEPYQRLQVLKARLDYGNNDAEDKRDLRADIRDEQKKIDRIVQTQRNLESMYKQNYLIPNFSQAEIDKFYQQRKQEIANGIWPNQFTNVVPSISPAGRDRKAVDLSPIDRGGGLSI